MYLAHTVFIKVCYVTVSAVRQAARACQIVRLPSIDG